MKIELVGLREGLELKGLLFPSSVETMILELLGCCWVLEIVWDLQV